MFTGIIEATGIVVGTSSHGSNRSFWISSGISGELKPDQSVSHNGVCLTVEEQSGGRHRVTAIEETLLKSNLGDWKEGSVINLERCLPMNGRLDGHLVQGHVDCRALCTRQILKEGSREFRFRFPASFAPLIIEKGSVAINGISLTAFRVQKKSFSVALIPYTYAHTNLQYLKEGDTVNIEFDMIGKYLHRSLSLKTVYKNRPKK